MDLRGPRYMEMDAKTILENITVFLYFITFEKLILSVVVLDNALYKVLESKKYEIFISPMYFDCRSGFFAFLLSLSNYGYAFSATVYLPLQDACSEPKYRTRYCYMNMYRETNTRTANNKY